MTLLNLQYFLIYSILFLWYHCIFSRLHSGSLTNALLRGGRLRLLGGFLPGWVYCKLRSGSAWQLCLSGWHPKVKQRKHNGCKKKPQIHQSGKNRITCMTISVIRSDMASFTEICSYLLCWNFLQIEIQLQLPRFLLQ